MFSKYAKRSTYRNASAMRKKPTAAERELRKHLYAMSRGRYRFQCQKIIAGYIADFYCAKVRVVVEVDGSSHAGREAHDQRRDAVLRERFGVITLRFSNEACLEFPRSVVEKILSFCDSCPVVRTWNHGLTKARTRKRVPRRPPNRANKP